MLGRATGSSLRVGLRLNRKTPGLTEINSGSLQISCVSVLTLLVNATTGRLGSHRSSSIYSFGRRNCTSDGSHGLPRSPFLLRLPRGQSGTMAGVA